MVFQGQYFKQFPEKVLGKIVTHSGTGRELTDRFNNPRPEVHGTLDDALSRIYVAPGLRYVHFEEGRVTRLSAAKEAAIVEMTKAEAKDQRSQASASTCGDNMVCLADSIKLYNTDVEYKDAQGNKRYYTISPQEITIFVTYQVNKGYWRKEAIRGSAWAKYLSNEENIFAAGFPNDLTAFDGEWHPASIFYSGNIYLKIQRVKLQQANIEKVVGSGGYQRILANLEAVKPKQLRFTTDPTEALLINPFDRIWDDFEFTEDSNGIPFEKSIQVRGVFVRWLNEQPLTAFVAENGIITSNPYDVISIWLDGGQFPRTSPLTEDEKVNIKRNSQIVGSALFERFCVEGIARDMQVQIEYLYNSTRNHYAQVQYHRIPVGFEVNKYFKGGALVIRPAQREGVSFSSSRGTGILGYDVGVGKTATAILSLEDGMSKGLFKRPLIITPNGVYWKWVAEIAGTKAQKDIYQNGKLVAKKGDLIGQGILPHRKVNTFYNLGVDVRVPTMNGKAYSVESGSISLITFDGLRKLGFGKDSEKELIDKVVAAISQSEGDRNAAQTKKTAEGWVDEALQKTLYNIEDFGFDAIVVDECHNFRVLFTEVKGDISKDGKREGKRFFSTGGTKPSGRALKLFMLNLFVQGRNNGRNTIGLSATPFTNRATEIYSILSLFDYEGLKEFQVNNLSQFCKNFIDETSEAVWTPQGEFDIKYVIRGYNNLPVLQTILFRSINYKTGEDADIKRPKKAMLPLLKDEKGIPLEKQFIVNTQLPNTEEQLEWIKQSYLFAGDDFEESEIFKTGKYDINRKTRKPDGQVLVAMNVARIATFSPYAIALKGERIYSFSELTPANFIKSSPKLEYVMGCIKSVKDYHRSANTPVSGQIIYSDVGTDFFGFIKDYLVRYVGFEKKEVAILTGDTTPNDREKIKAGFQDNTVKVLIGSSAIREGMDLQNHCSVIYNCYFDWNPTDLHQLFGRGFRYGNKFEYIRLVNPMVSNSSDIFTWQKLSEKMSRLSSVWQRTGQTKMFEEKELNAEELKRGLITSPEALANYMIDEETNKKGVQWVTLEAEKKEVEVAIKAKQELERFTTGLKNEIQLIENYQPDEWWIKSYPDSFKKLEKAKEKPYTWDDIKTVYNRIKTISRLSSELSFRPSLWLSSTNVDGHIKALKSISAVEKNLLPAYRMTINELPEVLATINEKIAEKANEMVKLRSDAYKEEKVAQATKEKEADKANEKTVADRVKEFARLNYLLDCKFEVSNCDLYSRGDNTPQPQQSAAPEKPKWEAVTDNAAAIGEALEALKIALQFTEGQQQQQLQEAVEALELAQQFL